MYKFLRILTSRVLRNGTRHCNIKVFLIIYDRNTTAIGIASAASVPRFLAIWTNMKKLKREGDQYLKPWLPPQITSSTWMKNENQFKYLQIMMSNQPKEKKKKLLLRYSVFIKERSDKHCVSVFQINMKLQKDKKKKKKTHYIRYPNV